MTQYTKPSLNSTAQITHLVSKGMTVRDRAGAEKWIERVGLYRFKGYAHVFKANGVYVNADFDSIRAIMTLDDELKIHILKGIQQIETSLRVVINEHMTHTYHAHWYADRRVMPERRRIGNKDQRMLTNAMELSIRVWSDFARSKEDSPKHYLSTYMPWVLPPSWMATEIISFGAWSKIYASLPTTDQIVIASKFNVDRGTLSSWLRDLTVLRNVSAHQARTWNRSFTNGSLYEPDPVIKGLSANSYVTGRPEATLAPRLYAMHHLLKALGDKSWARGLRLINRFSRFGLHHTGLKSGWESQPEWR
ncbi:hypothetical protein DM785_16540 (plasmid) [Deinococcus actinosclerus]|nr:hypothetical protein DM785_16540 [Deinococcus actinosclerus]